MMQDKIKGDSMGIENNKKVQINLKYYVQQACAALNSGNVLSVWLQIGPDKERFQTFIKGGKSGCALDIIRPIRTEVKALLEAKGIATELVKDANGTCIGLVSLCSMSGREVIFSDDTIRRYAMGWRLKHRKLVDSVTAALLSANVEVGS